MDRFVSCGHADLLLPHAAADAASGADAGEHQLRLGDARYRGSGSAAALCLAHRIAAWPADVHLCADTFCAQARHAGGRVMLAPSAKPIRYLRLHIALRFAWRELRGGLRGFGVFIACIALGVMAIAGVGSVAASLNDGLASAGRTILGGDLDFSLIQREASAAERSFLDGHATVSAVATLRAMARTSDGRSNLVEVKAVDGNYPLVGAAVSDPATPLSDLFAQNGGAYGAAVEPALLTRLDLKTGDRIA